MPRIVVGSMMARALYRVWSGLPVTVVDSPRGAGKSTLDRDIVAHLVPRSDVPWVATFTREQAKDIAGRIAAVTAPNTVCLAMRGQERRDVRPRSCGRRGPYPHGGRRPGELGGGPHLRGDPRHVGAEAPGIGLLIVDEA